MPLIDRVRHQHIIYSYITNPNVAAYSSIDLGYKYAHTAPRVVSVLDRFSPYSAAVLLLGPRDDGRGNVDCEAGFEAVVVHGFAANKELMNTHLEYRWSKRNPSGVILGNIKEAILAALNDLAKSDINISMAFAGLLSRVTNFLLPILGYSSSSAQDISRYVRAIMHLLTQGRVVMPEKEFAIFDGFHLKMPNCNVSKTYVTIGPTLSLSSIGMAVDELSKLKMLPRFLIPKDESANSNNTSASASVNEKQTEKPYRELRLSGTRQGSPESCLVVVSSDIKSAVLDDNLSKTPVSMGDCGQLTLYEAFVWTRALALYDQLNDLNDGDALALPYLIRYERQPGEKCECGKNTLVEDKDKVGRLICRWDGGSRFGDFDYDKIAADLLGIKIPDNLDTEEILGAYILLQIMEYFNISSAHLDLIYSKLIELMRSFDEDIDISPCIERIKQYHAKLTAYNGYKREQLPAFPDPRTDPRVKNYFQDVVNAASALRLASIHYDNPDILRQTKSDIVRKIYDNFRKKGPTDERESFNRFVKAVQASAMLAGRVPGIDRADIFFAAPTEDFSVSEQAVKQLHNILAVMNFVQLFPPGGYNFIPDFKALVASIYHNRPCVTLASSEDATDFYNLVYYVGFYGIVFRNVERLKFTAIDDITKYGFLYLLPGSITIQSSNHYTYPSHPKRYGEFSYPTWVTLGIDFIPLNDWLFFYGNYVGIETLAQLLRPDESITEGGLGSLSRAEAQSQIKRLMEQCSLGTG